MTHQLRRVAAAAVLAVGFGVALPGGAQTGPDPCAVSTSERIVAIGDVHGAYERFVAILRTAGLVDNRQRWSGGRAVLVQTGDIVDRGAESRRALDLLRRLERDAQRAGGQVHALLGNHEVMRMLGDFRDVSQEEYAAFRVGTSEEFRDRVYEKLSANAEAKAKAAGQPFDDAAYRRRFLEETPLGAIEMRIEFGPEGEYGRWLRGHNTMVRINDIVFVHGGINPAISSLGCQMVNETVRTELRADATATDPNALSNSETGPLWYRGLASGPEASLAADVEMILERLGARTIVVGHTVNGGGSIVTRFGGRVVQIDTGMLNGKFYPRGRPSALEINGDTFTAIYEDGREALTVPSVSVPR
jgi:hypothetical protein